MPKIITCPKCTRRVPHYAKGLCKACYGRLQMRRYRAEGHGKEDPEKVRARVRRWQKENPEKVAVRDHRYRKKNQEKVAASHRRYREENPEKIKARKARRRTRKAGVANTLTPGQIEFERRIGEAIYPNEELHLHHLVSISKGGGHTWGNIAFIPAPLNIDIGDKLPQEVYRQLAIPFYGH